MKASGIDIDRLPSHGANTLIVGFSGWGNAMDVSTETVRFLSRALGAKPFARLSADAFYRYDGTRPDVTIEAGLLREVTLPRGEFLAASAGKGVALLDADEPSLNWQGFAEGLLFVCRQLHVRQVITLGSMHDNVLPTDRIVSGLASGDESLAALQSLGVVPISYSGPSAVHSIVHVAAVHEGLHSISLWGHCPYYLQGTTHFGLLSTLAGILGQLAGFSVDTEALESQWAKVGEQIRRLIEKNPEMKTMIDDLRKAKVRGTWNGVTRSGDSKVIDIRGFFK
jgi:predicted ATP-grasp superfamily ATP-dependent carboligase